jgi:hypothetical protein
LLQCTCGLVAAAMAIVACCRHRLRVVVLAREQCSTPWWLGGGGPLAQRTGLTQTRGYSANLSAITSAKSARNNEDCTMLTAARGRQLPQIIRRCGGTTWVPREVRVCRSESEVVLGNRQRGALAHRSKPAERCGS